MNAYEKNGVFHCDCGFSWLRGESGNHNCADGLREKVKQLAAENVELKTFCKNAAFDADYESELGMERGGFTDALNNIETSVTDRLVAGIKADEEKEVLNDLLRHLEKIDIGSLSSPWELSSEVVAFVNSRLLREGADK
ncbi:hypothetical protein KX721_14425 [Klebsiella quasipneumoniae]|uniref:hypothetical protein n=1 Tax=Klebsiella quasipneumoniae TaxID=1463165 RepID=UPI001CA436E8|nr:hypothetical protein [Klebsiella quasipneumoniae]MBY8385097.1 hypothetical protein [Klebsiella quasipneumoniae]